MNYYVFCQGDILLTFEGGIPSDEIKSLSIKPWQIVTTLSHNGKECCVVRLDKPHTTDPLYYMCPLRKGAEILSQAEYQFAGKCAELVYWDQNTRFCGVCGSPLKWQTSISKQCPECGKEWWPSLAIATIVRIERNDEILMVRAKNFRGDFHGLVAGFVETGETLEECACREVWEETRIQIKNLRYFGSQPWPYPCGLMVGFTAEYDGGDLSIQKDELSSGGWFNRSNLPILPSYGSIAREMIDDWLNRDASQQK